MIWTGAIIALFIVYHVLDLTTGSAHLPQGSYVHLDPAVNLSEGFTQPLPVVLYIVAMIALGFHLWHGVYSMFSTLGLSHPRYTEGVKRLAAAAATIIALADISFPVAVFMNLVRYTG
jgi:succinate dehydrogenase / fumarate reductase cytochrome b subunit